MKRDFSRIRPRHVGTVTPNITNEDRKVDDNVEGKSIGWFYLLCWRTFSMMKNIKRTRFIMQNCKRAGIKVCTCFVHGISDMSNEQLKKIFFYIENCLDLCEFSIPNQWEIFRLDVNFTAFPMHYKIISNGSNWRISWFYDRFYDQWREYRRAVAYFKAFVVSKQSDYKNKSFLSLELDKKFNIFILNTWRNIFKINLNCENREK